MKILYIHKIITGYRNPGGRIINISEIKVWNKKFIVSFIFIFSILLIKAQNCTINAGTDKSFCVTQSEILSGNAAGSFITSPHWTQESGETINIYNPNSLTTKIIGFKGGQVYTFKLSATCSDGKKIYDKVTFSSHSYPKTPNAGEDKEIKANGSTIFKLNANKPDSGHTGKWSIIAGVNGIIKDSVSHNSELVITTNACNTTISFILRWTISNGYCELFDEIHITYFDTSNIVVDAGPDQNIKCSNKTTLKGSCTGNGNNIGTWSLLSGPSGSVFGNIHDKNSTFSKLQKGVYELKWSVGNQSSSSYDVVKINVISTDSVSTAVVKNYYLNYCESSLPAQINIEGSKYKAGEKAHWEQVSGNLSKIISDTAINTFISGISLPGNYNYIWSISNGICTSTASLTISVFSNPVSMAGSDKILPVGIESVQMTPLISNGVWSLASGPDTPVISGNKITGMKRMGTYILKYNTENACGTAYDLAKVFVSVFPGYSNSGTNQVFACKTTEGNLAANVPSSGYGMWSQVSGPNNSIIENNYSSSTKIKGLVSGEYKFRWTIDGGVAASPAYDDVSIFVATNLPTQANAGKDITWGYNSPICLKGNSVSDEEVCTWKQISGESLDLRMNGKTSCIISGTKANKTYTFVYIINNACGWSSDTVQLTTTNVQGPSMAIAGDDICITSDTKKIKLNATLPSFGKGKWIQVKGPSQLKIDDTSLSSTSISNIVMGSYLLVWSVSVDYYCLSDTIMITCSDFTTTAFANEDQKICDDFVILNGNKPKVGVGHWEFISGQGGSTFEDIFLSNTKVSNLIAGEYIFRWIITNGACSSSFDDIKVIISKAPSNARVEKTLIVSNFSQVELKSNAPNSGLGAWVIAKADYGFPSIPDITSTSTTINNLQPGITKVVWTITGGLYCPVSADTAMIIYLPKPETGLRRSTCQAKNIQLEGTDPGKGSGYWVKISGRSCKILNPENRYSNVENMEAGTYIFEWIISGNGNKAIGYTDTIDILAIPSAANAGKKQILYGANNIETVLNAEIPLRGYGKWTLLKGADVTIVSPNLHTTKIAGLSEGNYIFKWTVSNGYCFNSDEVEIIVSDTLKQNINHVNSPVNKDSLISHLYIPNAFSPNDDGLNDYFKPYDVVGVTYIMEIYNKWGEKIYSGNESEMGWNGKLQNESCMGDTYYYQVKYSIAGTEKNVEKDVLLGTIKIIR